MNEDELVVDKQRATNHLGSEVARHQPVRGIGSLGFDSRRLHSTHPRLAAAPRVRSWQATCRGHGECPERGTPSERSESRGTESKDTYLDAAIDRVEGHQDTGLPRLRAPLFRRFALCWFDRRPRTEAAHPQRGPWRGVHGPASTSHSRLQRTASVTRRRSSPRGPAQRLDNREEGSSRRGRSLNTP